MGHFVVVYEVWLSDDHLEIVTRKFDTYEDALVLITKLLRELITFKCGHVPQWIIDGLKDAK